MSNIKYISFFKKDAVFDSERIVGELLDVCEQTDLGEDNIICKIQVVQGELVHCKDCKYCDRHHLVDGLFCYRLYEKYNKEYPQMIIEVDADDFCSRGEKKDE